MPTLGDAYLLIARKSKHQIKSFIVSLPVLVEATVIIDGSLNGSQTRSISRLQRYR